MFAASKTGRAVAAGVATDQYFPNTVLLLNDTGTNGAQNNTFIDSSTNNFSITRNGNATQGSVNPYEPTGYWSMYSPGGGSTLTTTAAGIAVGTGNFTYEGWFFFTTIGSVTEEQMACSRGIGVGWQTTRRTTNWTLDLNSTTSLATATGVLTTNNVWYHIAVTRQSGTIRLFTNGVLNTTVTGNTSNFTSTSFCLGALNLNTDYNLVGNFSNFRFVASTVLYTATFTPPTTPLTAISGTVLLIAQNNRFIDNSSNNFTMTVNGSPVVSGFNPFAPTASYSGATYGGTMYLDGNGDYLDISSNSAFTYGVSDFTIECWVYLTAVGAIQYIYDQRNSGTANAVIPAIYVSASNVLTYFVSNAARITGTTALVKSTWYHVAVCRSTSNTKMFLNGVQEGSTYVDANNYATSRVVVSSNAATIGNYLTGFISNLRVVNGTAVYTSTFTPPTTPVTAITNTQLLLNATNAGIYDATALNDMETVGNAQVSTTQYKWGASSMSFDGTGDWLLFPDNVNITLNQAVFTIEGWIYLNAVGSARGIVGKGTGTTGWLLSINSSNQVVFTDTTTAITSTGTLSVSTWYHIAVVRSTTGTNQTKIYINGTNDGTGTSATNFSQTNLLYVGADRTGGSAFNGYIEDLRITKGVARYTANFTAPTAAFPTR